MPVVVAVVGGGGDGSPAVDRANTVNVINVSKHLHDTVTQWWSSTSLSSLLQLVLPCIKTLCTIKYYPGNRFSL